MDHDLAGRPTTVGDLSADYDAMDRLTGQTLKNGWCDLY